MTFVVDIDDTLLLYPADKTYDDIWERYKDAIANKKEIEFVNGLFDAGHCIILHTGRNWDKYEITKKQLKEFNINHHELVMGKPQGVYIDKDSYKSIRRALIDLNVSYGSN